MIQGIYEKDGSVTEFVGSGIEEIKPERTIHVIPMVSKKRRPRRRVDSFTPSNAIMMGLAVGMPFGVLTAFAAMSHDKVMQLWTVASIIVSAIWLYENFWRKR